MSDYIDITPNVHFLQSIRADRGSWQSLLAEAVDNSLDADATEIDILLSRNEVVIADNGRGITKDRESAIVRLGEHGAMPGTNLGRYGMGIKYNATSAGDLLDVESTSADGHMVLTVDWAGVIRSGKWLIPQPRWTPSLVSRGTGTTITIGRLRWNTPKDKDVSVAREHLAQIFYPAIENNITIRVGRQALQLLREPKMYSDSIVDQQIQLPNGKGAHVRGGILVHPENSLYQVQVSYKHRVIKPKSTFGCGTYSGLRRMFARVTLTADWGLTRFKDDLNDPDTQELEEAVEEVLRPVLEKCHSAQLQLKVDELTEQLNELLPPEIQAARPPRKREQTKDDRPKRRRAQHQPVDKDQDDTGPARLPKAPINRLTIAFDGPHCEEHGYGFFTKGRINRITLATDNPDIAALLEVRDTRIALRSLLGFALMIYQHAKETDLGQGSLPFEGSTFGQRVWKIAARQLPEETVIENHS